jgi:hypothetical protein
MTKHEQTKLLEAIIDNMKASLMAKVENFPENWDGFEMRQYLADQFAQEARPMDRARMRNYRNDVMTRPL